MNDDELFDDIEEGIVNEPESQPIDESYIDDGSYSNESPAQEIDLTAEVLQSKNIDPSNIIFVDDNGQTYSKSWNDLSLEEQKNILSWQPDPELDLDNDEIDLINRIRQAGTNPVNYINTLIQASQPVEEIQNRIDDLTDEQVYMLHLDMLAEQSGKELSDEELIQATEDAKQNESLFKTQVDGLRNQFRERENEQEYLQQQQQAYAHEQEFAQFEDAVLSNIESIDTFAGYDLELSEDDKNELASFILDRDETGTSEFGRILSDPQVLVQLAFLASKGGEIFSGLESNYSQQIQNAYNNGYMAATQRYGGQVAIKSHNNTKDTVLTVDNAFDDDW